MILWNNSKSLWQLKTDKNNIRIDIAIDIDIDIDFRIYV